MMIQPFVENAFKHGLSQAQGAGRIDLHFTIDKDHLICSILDNGIGRQASAALRDETHRSLGMQITGERLEDLRRKTKSDAKFEITDLHDSDGKATGTKVIVMLPLLHQQ
jgi:sensor histidine kinase YesM